MAATTERNSLGTTFLQLTLRPSFSQKDVLLLFSAQPITHLGTVPQTRPQQVFSRIQPHPESVLPELHQEVLPFA